MSCQCLCTLLAWQLFDYISGDISCNVCDCILSIFAQGNDIWCVIIVMLSCFWLSFSEVLLHCLAHCDFSSIVSCDLLCDAEWITTFYSRKYKVLQRSWPSLAWHRWSVWTYCKHHALVTVCWNLIVMKDIFNHRSSYSNIITVTDNIKLLGSRRAMNAGLSDDRNWWNFRLGLPLSPGPGAAWNSSNSWLFVAVFPGFTAS